MKKNIHIVISFIIIILFAYSCTSRPNQMKEPVNSTMSGSHATETSNSSQADTLNPVQPNGLDTSGEQTGRMNKTIMVPIPQQQTGDSSNKVHPKK